MDVRKRKRKICDRCQQEYSDRHFRRHKHDTVLHGGDCPACPEATDVDVRCVDIVAGSNHSSVKQTDSLVSNTKSETVFESTATFFDEKSDTDMYASSTDEGDLSFDDSDLEELFSDLHQKTGSGSDMSDTMVHSDYVHWVVKLLEVWQSRFNLPGAALSFILLLIKSILFLCSQSSILIKEMYNEFPSTLYQMHVYMSHKKDDFIRYVVCPKCYALYSYENCFEVIEGSKLSKVCNRVQFPFHPLPHLRVACGQTLLKEVKMQSHTKLVPFKTYCYKSLESTLATLIKRPDFEEKCEMWRKRELPDDILADVYDGNIWKEFAGDKWDFLSHRRNYALMLNVDWFQPFKRSTYSVGGVYLAILNLPREERFKRENMMLVGLIPDMKSEPPTNSFIEPLVDDLKTAWEGFYLKSSKSPDVPVKFRLALLCVGCDIPASRKLCGFLGHSATMGCNKCLKAFSGEFGKKNYGGFDNPVTLRDSTSHREQVQRTVRAKTKSSKEEIEREYGVRYSVLLELPYFDPIRMTVVDPMHNLFLGTSKRMLSVWKATDIVTDDNLISIQTKIEAVQCPSDVGKLPLKFSSCYNSFTADQWKNWTLMFSIFALKDIIPQKDLECWRKFVLACKMLTTRILHKSSVDIAHKLLLAFCMKFEQLYGQERVTPNMHLHIHLQDCIKDFGPVYSFWLFSFERENGILESIPTNKRNIETQLMRRFLQNMSSLNNTCNPAVIDHFGTDFKKLLKITDTECRGSLGQMSNLQNFELTRMSSRNFNFQTADWGISEVSDIRYSVSENVGLTDDELRHLTNMYCVLYPMFDRCEMIVCNSGKRVKQVSVCGNKLGTKDGRSFRSSMVLAYWCGHDGMINEYDSVNLTPRPGQIDKQMLHTVFLRNKPRLHLIVKIKWFVSENETMSNRYGKPVEVWKSDVFERDGSAMFMPIQRIKSKFVYVLQTIENKNVIVVMPRDRYLA